MLMTAISDPVSTVSISSHALTLVFVRAFWLKNYLSTFAWSMHILMSIVGAFGRRKKAKRNNTPNNNVIITGN